jgi:DinB superfamily
MMSATFVRPLLDQLTVSPVRLRALLTSLPESALRSAPAGGGFAPIEDAWHLRDIEAEGHFLRIRRILAEELPVLASIDGERLARERHYLGRELGTALDEFAQYREASVGLLGPIGEEAWSRTAIFEDRVVSLGELVTAMAAHDDSHLAALAAQLSGARKLADDPCEAVPVSHGTTPAAVAPVSR